MADITDVGNTLAGQLQGVLYPNGTGSPSIAATDIRIYQGWPNAATLDDDLAAGKAHVSIWPRPEEKNTTRYMNNAWQTQSINPATLTLTIAGQHVTVGGTVTTPQNVMLMVGYQPYVYAVQSGDTLNSVAAALAALVPGASGSGAVVTVPNASIITAARVGVTGTAAMETKRQERTMQISVWANTPALRDTIARAIDGWIPAVPRFTLPDDTSARLIYKQAIVVDDVQKANLYRRDFLCSVEYATTTTEIETQITQEQFGITNEVAGVQPFSTTIYL